MKLKFNENIEIREFHTLEEVAESCKEYLTPGNIALSGGSTYLKLLREWSKGSLNLEGVEFFPVDERVVEFDDPMSNWGNSYRDFLSKYSKNREHHFTDSEKYNDYLKDKRMNTIFLGVGDDGHTASLFSIDEVFNSDKKAISTISPKEPKNRISLTGKYIIESDNIVIIFLGEGKEDIVRKVLNNSPLPITKLLSKVSKGTIYIHRDLIKE